MATQKNRGANKAEKEGTGKQLASRVQADAKKDQLPATIDMAAHSGGGMENTDRDSFAIPFLAIVQKGSPQVDKDSDAFIKGLEVGDLLLTSTGEVFKDEDGVDVIFCGYRRVFLRWAPQDSGGGFKGEISVDEVGRMKASGALQEEDNKLFADNGDIVRDTRVHYVLVVRPDGSTVPAVLSVSSTQIKKSKMLMTQIQSFVATDANGKSFTPPSYGHIFHAETVAESNDKGSWRGWKFTRTGYVSDPKLFQQAIEFNKLSKSESVKVDYDGAERVAGGERADDDNI